MLTVEKLIEILSKIENKKIPVEFSYNSRALESAITCIDLVNGGESLMFRGEDYNEYCHMNPNYISETKESAIERLTKDATEFYKEYVKDYGISPIEKKVLRDLEEWEFFKQDTMDHVNLYLERD